MMRAPSLRLSTYRRSPVKGNASVHPVAPHREKLSPSEPRLLRRHRHEWSSSGQAHLRFRAFGYYSPEHEEADLLARVAGGVSERPVLVACAELLARPSAVAANPYCSCMGIRS